MVIPMITATGYPPSPCMPDVEAFMLESGEYQRLLVGLVVAGLERHMDQQQVEALVGHEAHTVYVRTFTHKNLLVDPYEAGLKLVEPVLAVDARVRISGIRTAKRERYMEVAIDICLAGTDPKPKSEHA